MESPLAHPSLTLDPGELKVIMTSTRMKITEIPSDSVDLEAPEEALGAPEESLEAPEKTILETPEEHLEAGPQAHLRQIAMGPVTLCYVREG